MVSLSPGVKNSATHRDSEPGTEEGDSWNQLTPKPQDCPFLPVAQFPENFGERVGNRHVTRNVFWATSAHRILLPGSTQHGCVGGE